MPGSDIENIETSLLSEIEELRSRLTETEETLNAIRNGEVDAIIVSGENGHQVFSLSSSETPYRIIIEEMDEGAVTVSSNGTILYSNQRFAELVSTPLEQVSGSAFSRFISEGDKPEFKRLLRTSLKKPIRGEVSATVQGKPVQLRLSLVPLPSNMEGDACIVVSDITEVTNFQNYLREMVEERTSEIIIANRQLLSDIKKIKKAEKELMESQEHYKLLSDTMLQGVIYRDASGLIVSLNPAAERILGKKAHEFIGRKTLTADLKMIHEDGSPYTDDEHPSIVALKTFAATSGIIMGIFNQVENIYRWISIDTMPLFRKGEDHPHQVYSMFEDITERKNTELEILRREELFRSAFDEGAIAMSLTSIDGRFLRVNHAFCKLTGYSETELKDLTFQDLTHPDDLDVSVRGRDEMKNGILASFRVEKRYIRKDGKYIWVNISSAPVRDENANWSFFVAHIQDISKRKSAENRLRESKEKFKQLANSIPQLAWIARSDGFIFWFNQRWYEYTGTKSEDVAGWGWHKVHDSTSVAEFIKQWKTHFSEGKPFEMVLSLAGKDGIYREFLTKCIPIKDKDGNVEQWFGTNTDISQLKKVESELNNSRRKLNIALENGNIGIWEWNLKTNEMTWDHRTEKMFHLKAGTFEGTYSAFENHIHEEDLPHVRKAITIAKEKDQPFETIYRSRPYYGKYNYISSKGLLTKDDDGKPLSMSGVSFDVSGMKKGTENVLIRMNEELLRSNTDLQQFAYVASHDLQEPLRMVSSFTQLLQQRYKDKLDNDGNEYIRFAVEGSKRMYDLLNGLLAYSRIQSRGKEFQKVDMNSVLGNVKGNLNLIIEETGAVIISNVLPVIFADESQMTQLIQNLIENSIKFRRGQPRMTISSKTERGFHLFSIQDEGIGIEPQYFDRIFKIFQRLHRSDEYEGTGIGLAICKRIVERHGGKIWIESTAGKGTTFFFTIPLVMINLNDSLL